MWYSNLTPNSSTITKQDKLKINKVGKLIDCAKILNIYYDGLFDDLMDKNEQTPELFQHMYEIVSTMVQRGNNLDIIEVKYLELLKIKTLNQLVHYTWF